MNNIMPPVDSPDNTFHDGNPATGEQGTIVPGLWLNNVQGATRNTQQELISVLTEAAIEIDESVDNQLLLAILKLISTRSPELPIASLTLKGIVQLSSSIASTSESLAATPKAVKTTYDAIPTFLTGVIGTSRNSRMSVTTASAVATFTADELIVQAALGGRQYKLSNFNKTINLATTGVGGMDTGTAPATGFVALYAIYNPTTQASALLAVNATSVLAPEVYGGANMPAGYTASALVSVWATASSQFKVGFQSDRHVSIPLIAIYSTTAGVTSLTPLVVGVAPQNATSVDMAIQIGQTVSGSGVGMYLQSNSTGIGQINGVASVSGATSSSTITGTLPLIETQRLYFSMTNTATGSYAMSCRGYDF
ncbi:tail fiber protein [Yersinia massiliensis]|uniref:tail fiber protein n=1 Tax=Yersinia massiliensis TaxID=419257 RepID=UPI001CFE3228|nr:tail fiber protein [Yersinia massiliensis]MCB5309202.1 phage tail protein [Yersinia massiliensis]